MNKLVKLPKELEDKLPEYIRIFREWYFSLSEEEKNKIVKKETPKKENISEWIHTMNKFVNETQGQNQHAKKINKLKDYKYCYDCGNVIKRNANYCEYCGSKQPKIC